MRLGLSDADATEARLLGRGGPWATSTFTVQIIIKLDQHFDAVMRKIGRVKAGKLPHPGSQQPNTANGESVPLGNGRAPKICTCARSYRSLMIQNPECRTSWRCRRTRTRYHRCPRERALSRRAPSCRVRHRRWCCAAAEPWPSTRSPWVYWQRVCARSHFEPTSPHRACVQVILKRKRLPSC